MKLLLFFALLISVALVHAQILEPVEDDVPEDEFNGGYDESEDDEIPILEEPDEDIDISEADGDEDEDDDDDDDDDEITIEMRPTGFPTRRRRPGCKCMQNARKCFMNATECEEYLGCYEQKSSCYKAYKKDQKPLMKKHPSKMICKTVFNKCLESAGSDCFKKYMCYRKKGFCYRSRGRGHRRPGKHHFRPHHRRGPHHHRRPTMNPEMLKCKMQWRSCFMRADNCSTRLQCMYDFHECMNRSRPTGPPPTMSPDEDEENMNVYRRRWNPKLMAKCKKEFHECAENATSCPMKMRCFWRMKMCFKSHHKPRYGYKTKMTVKITRMGQTGRQWGNRGMGNGYRQTGRRWGNRGMGNGFKQTGRQWENRGMGNGFRQTGRQWGNRGMGNGFKRTGKMRWGIGGN